ESPNFKSSKTVLQEIFISTWSDFFLNSVTLPCSVDIPVNIRNLNHNIFAKALNTSYFKLLGIFNFTYSFTHKSRSRINSSYNYGCYKFINLINQVIFKKTCVYHRPTFNKD